MVKLRLKRMGAKKVPFYRIVAADARARRDGRDIEIVGTYDPTKQPAIVNIDEEKVLNWLNKGAVPTDTVRSLLSKNGTMKKFLESKKSK
ncbi:MAG: 30S ribosomal protein S16 [Erysipelotrichaceae bacterium]|nr:30S ribosomal protein S16 [Erysipelotrichaceae bacterium]MBR2533508.1 30S ribosomal protein S16 [Erysipelotrichaceae bacterium]